MADTTTPNLGLVKPAVGGSDDSWGDKSNDNWDKVDAGVAVKSKANVYSAAQTMPNLKIVDAAGTNRNVEYRTDALLRWALITTSAAETGADAGSNFQLVRYNDAGASAGTPFSVSRATGLVTTIDLQATTLNIGAVDTTITRIAAGQIAVEGNAVALENRANVFTAVQTIDGGAANGYMRVAGDAGTQRGYLLRTGNATRFAVLINAAAETGANNAGSDFAINRYNDAGSAISTALSIERSNGNVTIYPLADQTPASNVGHFVIRGAAYAGGLSLDAAGLWLSHNSVSRALIFGINHVEAGRFATDGTFMVGRTTGAAGTEGFWVAKTGIFRSDLVGTNQCSLNKTSADGTVIVFQRAQVGVGSIAVTASATAYNTTSDYRVKTEVQPMQNAITELMQLKPSTFEFINDRGKRVPGFIAHEVQEIVPTAVTGEKDAMRVVAEHEETPEHRAGTTVPDLQAIDQSKLVPLLTAALQEAIRRIEALEAK